jgi:hypothetical protein
LQGGIWTVHLEPGEQSNLNAWRNDDMTYGRAYSHFACALPLGIALLLTLPAVTPTMAAPAKPGVTKSVTAPPTLPKSVHVVTFDSADDTGIHVTQADGTTLDAEIRPSSQFFLNGIAASPSDFKPGTKVLLRTRTRNSDGVVSVVMLSDTATQSAIDAYRRKPLLGRVVSVDEKTMVVQPEGAGATPVTLHVTQKTLFRKKSADATATDFPVGSAVTVITRGLPSGLLMGSIVSDQLGDAEAAKAALKPISLVGTAVDVQPDKGLLTLAPKTKPRQTIAVVDATKIKVEKIEGVLRQITPGMRVSARLGHQKDADGHLIATSLSAFPILAKPLHKSVAIKKAP